MLEIAWCIATTEELLAVPIETHLIALPEGESIPYRVREITKITDEEMLTAKPQGEALHLLRAQISGAFPNGKAPTVAHYATFEKTFLNAAWAEEFPDAEFPFEFVCTQKIAKFLYPGMTSFSLRAVSGFFGATLHLDNRASSHVETTVQVWLGIAREMNNRGIESLEALEIEINAPKPKKVKSKTKPKKTFEYRMPREKRLKFPDQPGIYKMFSNEGQILYVGKATSLKSRVNSYFRGGTTKDRRKQELMAQVWDIEVVPCRSPLEAALLESDEIKKWTPRYNVALRESRRPIIYFDREFSTTSTVRTGIHRIGPFKGRERLDQLMEFFGSLQVDELGQPFWDEVEPSLIAEGWVVFNERHAIRPANLGSVRALLAVGMELLRKQQREMSRMMVEDLDAPTSEIGEVDEDSRASVEAHADSYAEADVESDERLSPEAIADRFERMFRGAAENVRRARKMQKLLTTRVRISHQSQEPHYLCFLNGTIVDEATWSAPLAESDFEVDSASYDRLSILLTALQSAQDVRVELPANGQAEL